VSAVTFVVCKTHSWAKITLEGEEQKLEYSAVDALRPARNHENEHRAYAVLLRKTLKINYLKKLASKKKQRVSGRLQPKNVHLKNKNSTLILECASPI
jgi:hypothetical protein